MKKALLLLLLSGCSSSPYKFYCGDVVEIKNGNFGIINKRYNGFENYYTVLSGGEIEENICEKDLKYCKSFNWRTGEFCDRID